MNHPIQHVYLNTVYADVLKVNASSAPSKVKSRNADILLKSTAKHQHE